MITTVGNNIHKSHAEVLSAVEQELEHLENLHLEHLQHLEHLDGTLCMCADQLDKIRNDVGGKLSLFYVFPPLLLGLLGSFCLLYPVRPLCPLCPLFPFHPLCLFIPFILQLHCEAHGNRPNEE